MPRQRIQDPTTPGLYTQVSWRRHDEIDDFEAPGHVQVSTINERADTEIARLLDEAYALLSQNDEAIDMDRWMAWIDRQARFRDELTGWYASHDPETITELIKVLHKAKRQAFPSVPPRIIRPNSWRALDVDDTREDQPYRKYAD
jgi:hypothetical protein